MGISGGGSSSRSSSQGRQGLATLSPGFLPLAQLFGLNVGFDQGGLNLLGKQGPSIFNRGDIQDIQSLTDPFKTLGFDRNSIGNLGVQSINQLNDVFSGKSLDAATARAQFEFGDLVSGLTEQLGTKFGLDSRDADTRAIVGREAANIATNLAAQDQNQKLLAAQLAPGLGANLLGLEQSALTADRLLSPAGQKLSLLGSLLGINTQSGGVGSQSSNSSSNNFNLGLGF